MIIWLIWSMLINFIIQNEINDNSGKILKTFQDRYKAYRLNWTNNVVINSQKLIHHNK